MFDFIKRLFGEGKIRILFTDTTGKSYPYIGDIDTLVEEELKQSLSDQWFVHTGHRIVKFKIQGWYQVRGPVTNKMA